MAEFTFPLGLGQFFDLLPVGAVEFEPDAALEVDETAGGEILTADNGSSLWRGRIDLALLTHDEAQEIAPLLNLLQRAGTSFMVADARRLAPRHDPGAALLGGAAVKVATVSGTLREMALSGLPAGYRLGRGDLLAFTYGGGAGRHALHELLVPVIANGNGQTPLFEVNPPLRAGVAPEIPVQLDRPACKAVIVPGSVDHGQSRQRITRNVSFRWTQTLR